MHKKRILYSLLILVLLIGIVITLQQDEKIAHITWPKSSDIIHNGGQNYQIKINEKFTTSHGKWGIHTEFLIEDNEIQQITSNRDLTFFGFLFKSGAQIERVDPETFELYLKQAVEIDGLDLTQECILEFKNKVLFSARCPHFDKVFFKRFISPDALNFDLEGTTQKVE